MTRAITIIVLITLALPLKSQTETKRENLIWRTVEWVNRNFVSQDTIYVSPEKYNLFKAEFVCCDDMFANIGDALAYGPSKS